MSEDKIEIYEEEYNVNPIKDDDNMVKLKEAVLNGLRPVERKILLTYAEVGTYTECAKHYHVSITTIRRYLDDIRSKVKNMINYDDDYSKPIID